MQDGAGAKSPLDQPAKKEFPANKEPREKIPKSRIHCYLPDELINQIDEKAHELQLPRSTMVQLVVKKGLESYV